MQRNTIRSLGTAERRSGSALYKGSSAIGADYSALSDKSSAQHDWQPGFSGAVLRFSAMQGIFSERRTGSALCKGSSASDSDYSALIDKYSAQHDWQPGFSGAVLRFSAMQGIFSERRSTSPLRTGSSASGADYSALSDKYSAQHDWQPGFSGAVLRFSAIQGIFSERSGLFSAKRQIFSATRFPARVQRSGARVQRYARGIEPSERRMQR